MADDKDKKKKKGIGGTLDKIFMGAIIGGAIGSVLGMGLAPKKGKETRRFLKEKAQEVIHKAEDLLKKEKPSVEEEIKNLANKARQRGTKIFNLINDSETESQNAETKKIPHEEK